MAIQVNQYSQRVDFGGAPGSPSPQVRYVESGIGQAIQHGADVAMHALAESERKTAESESLLAASKSHMELEEAFRNAQETAKPGAAQFTPEFMGNVDRATEATIPTLSSDAARKRYRERMAGVALGFQERSLGFEAQERQANRIRSISEAGDNAGNTIYTVDGAARDLTYQNLQRDFDNTLENIGLLPHQKDQLRDELKNKMSFAGVQADIRDRPDKVQDWLVKGVKSPSGVEISGVGSDYFSKLRATESSGPYDQSTTSSAFGPYQFTVGTWKAFIGKHPELGLTEADRMVPAQQEGAIRVFAADQAAVLKRAGFEPTNTNLYMTHLLGDGGGPRFLNALQANPSAPAASAVDPAQAEANPGIFKPGRTVGDVYALFRAKMEGPGGGPVTAESVKQGSVSVAKASDAPSYYADVSIAKRDAYYSQAEAELQKRRVQGEAAFKQTVQNSIAEFAATGVSTKAPTENEFVAAMGAPRGTVAYGEFVANSQAAEASYKVQRMPLHEGMQYVETLKPLEGDPFYAEKLRGYTAAKEAATRVQQQALTDFGQHVVNINPQAKAVLLDAVSNQNPDAARAAANKYAAIIDAEGDRLGVTGARRSFLPKAYSEEVAAQLNQKFTNDAQPEGVVNQLNAFKARWGDNWPKVYSELKDSMSGPVQVITSGIQQKAAVILTQVHNQSFDDVTKTLTKADKQTITDEVKTAFKPFVTSTGWQQSAVPGVMTFYEQARKLAGVYAVQGTDPSTAADQAYKDLLGFKYRLVDTSGANLRIPKPEDHPDLEAKLRVELAKIKLSDSFMPSTQEISAMGVDDAKARLEGWIERNAKWVTLPDDSGVGLMIAGELRADSRGKPVKRTWDQIKANEMLSSEKPVAGSFGPRPFLGKHGLESLRTFTQRQEDERSDQ